MEIKRKIVYLLMVVITVSSGPITGSVYAAEKSLQINYRLKWLFNASVVGDLYADVNGCFKRQGMDVTVKEGGPERDAIRELELGYANFGVASADQVIRALAKGAPVVVIAQLFQVNPLQWIYRTDKFNIQRIGDLKEKIIGITYGGNDETIMRTILAKGGISEKDVTLFSVRYDYTPFYQGKVDVWPVYRNSQGITIASKLNAAGEKTAYFNPAEHGVQFVANSVVTSKQMINDHPEVVEKFIVTLLDAWEESLTPEKRHPVLKMIGSFDKDTPSDLLEQQLDVTKSLVKPSAKVKVGRIDGNAWKQTEKIMLDQRLIEKPVNVEKALKYYVK